MTLKRCYKLEKILIISYFFPPCSLTASQRTHFWANQLINHNYYPEIVTRNWDQKIENKNDISLSSGKENKIKKNNKHKLHILKFKGSLKDKIYSKYGNEKYKSIRKVLTFTELVFQNFFLFGIYKDFYVRAEKIIKDDPSIEKIIITANPFNLFHIGYKLKKKHSHIKWVADYRDDWTTSEINDSSSIARKIISALETKSEKKWLSNSSLFTTVSDHYKNKIQHHIKIKGYTIINGFDDKLLEIKPSVLKLENEFIICYVGTLYNTQPIEELIDVVITLINNFKDKIKIKVLFPGLGYDKKQTERVINKFKGYENNFKISERIPQQEVFDIIKSSHLMLMLSHKGKKGIPSSKLYEYIGFNKNILLYPNDYDIIEKTLNDCSLGQIAENSEELYLKIEDLITNFRSPTKKNKKITSFSRSHQTTKLADILNNI